MRVVDADSQSPVPKADVYIDGSFVGGTGADGRIAIPAVEEGSHTIEARGDWPVRQIRVDIRRDGQGVDIPVEAPKTVEIKVINKFTGAAIDGASVTLGNEIKSTSFGGVAQFVGMKQGSYIVSVKFKDAQAEERISVTGSSTAFTIPIQAPVATKLLIKDRETGKTIDQVQIKLEPGQSPGCKFAKTDLSTQTGEVSTELVPCEYRVSVSTPDPGTGKYLSLDAGYITLEPGTNDLAVDMPNPVLSVTGSIDHGAFLTKEWAACKNVKVTNTGTIVAENVKVICIVYEIIDEGKPTQKVQKRHIDTIDFGDVFPGQTAGPKTSTYGEYSFSFGTPEDIVMFATTTYKYAPPTTSLELKTSAGFAEQVWNNLVEWCGGEKLIKCGEIVGKTVGEGLKPLLPLLA